MTPLTRTVQQKSSPTVLVKFQIGQRVRVLAAIDYMPYTIIRAGESGKIIATDAPEGVEVFLDEHHPKLAQWDNCILLLPEETIKLVGSSE